MIKHVLCDYSLASMRLSDLPDFGYLKQFYPDFNHALDGEFLFLVLPDSAMPAVSTDIYIPADYLSHSIVWHIKDELDGKQLCFQIGSASQPLADNVVQQMESHGFIFVIFINSRSGTPKGVRIFKKSAITA